MIVGADRTPAFRPRIISGPGGTFLDLTREQKLELYRFMRLNRVVEERLVNLYRQGKVVGGLYRSLGQEATSVGTAYALRKGDIVGPLIRNLGVVLVMGYSPRDVMTQYMARATSPSGGKDCNLHFGRPERGVISPISMLGALVPVMAGIALAARMQKKDLVTMTWIGDGGTSTGAFHEGINFAAVQKLPLVIVAENNGWAYSTPRAQADGRRPPRGQGRRPTAFRARPSTATTCSRSSTRRAARSIWRAIGRRPHAPRGRDVPDEGTRRARRPGLRARRRSSRSGSPGTRSNAIRRTLVESGAASANELAAIDQAISDEIDREVEFAEKSPMPQPEFALEGVYAKSPPEAVPAPSGSRAAAPERMSGAPHLGGDGVAAPSKGQTTYVDAIREGLREEMQRDERVFLLGEDIGVYGGAFKVTDGLCRRVRRGARHRHADRRDRDRGRRDRRCA